MAALSDIPLTFTVRRCKPEFVAPAKPTPCEQKLLSDIDDQAILRFQARVVHFYRHQPSMEGKHPAEVIRTALAQALVLYYPFAGRLREGANGKLIVDCNGEGVLFIKADADVRLEQFGDTLQPPFPCFDQLLFDVPGSEGLLNCPLLLIQVTRLKCGGFIFAVRFNHVMSDGPGLKQFLSTVAAMARGEATHLIPPVWERHLLDAPNPPRVTFTHHEYDEVEAAVTTTTTSLSSDNLVERSFFFGPAEFSLLRRLLPPHLRHCTKFELLTAFLWRCRSLAINLDPEEEVRMLCAVNARYKIESLLPQGYYGNAFVIPAAITTVKKLRQNPLGYAVELVKQAKASLTEEYVKSVAALMVIRGKRLLFPNVIGSFIISDITKMGLEDVDFGWGKAVFAGTAKAEGVISYFVQAKNKKGEVGTSVAICLPAPAMERFAEEMDNMLKQQPIEDKKSKSIRISSAM
ncbi:hypothetical protein like AT5G17540 [Hibiscus trionum]|uniref:Benzyl alcohol O-benzoyltransferase n=1 Tax=Hibiscus trionum TaxID=183268 RepID=A0A9W7JGP2_HIBTR|nr:hypothetical protein like AT5G17540 [Hibiscus trionum]